MTCVPQCCRHDEIVENNGDVKGSIGSALEIRHLRNTYKRIPQDFMAQLCQLSGAQHASISYTQESRKP